MHDRGGIITGQKVTEAKAQRAWEFRRHPTDAQRILWQSLRAGRLSGFHFRRQQVIDGFIVDFYCHAAGLVVEVDSPSHTDQAEYDMERDRILSARGLHILRLANDEVKHNLTAVLDRIAAECHTNLCLGEPDEDSPSL